MEHERIIFTYEIRPGQMIRVGAIGDVNIEMIEALKAFVEFQEKFIKRALWLDVQTPLTVGISVYPENALFKTSGASKIDGAVDNK